MSPARGITGDLALALDLDLTGRKRSTLDPHCGRAF